MNKKSRIKSTLDSLFTTGKVPVEGTKPRVEKPDSNKEESKPPKPVKKPATSTKPIVEEHNQPTVKPVEIPSEIPILEPVETNVTVKESAVDTPIEKSTLPQASTAAVSPPMPAFEKKKVDEEQVRRIAQNIDQAAQIISGDEEHLVIFSLGKELYGVTIHSVESIIKLQDITEVPRSASYILGVTNLRGTVVPVLDLRRRFNLASCENTSNTRIIIVNAEGSKVGIVVDEVTEVLKVAREAIQPPPPMSTTIESAFINGIAHINENLVILLDLEKVLASSSRKHNR